LTTERNVPHSTTDSSLGGDFYDATLGVYVRAAIGTLVVFPPSDWHGTTLLNMEPRDAQTIMVQAGISIVTSSRIGEIFEKFKEGRLTKKEALKEAKEAVATNGGEVEEEVDDI
jgi:hypothetical protein